MQAIFFISISLERRGIEYVNLALRTEIFRVPGINDFPRRLGRVCLDLEYIAVISNVCPNYVVSVHSISCFLATNGSTHSHELILALAHSRISSDTAHATMSTFGDSLEEFDLFDLVRVRHFRLSKRVGLS
jgi:hypothetical protein